MRGLYGATLAISLLGIGGGGYWEKYDDRDGITLWRRRAPGSHLVTFRGRGSVGASIDRVTAVLRGSERDPEWMADCVDAATVRFLSVTDAVIYHRTGSPVPFISDRDTVLKVATKVDAGRRTILMTFTQTRDPLRPPVKGVVRMPRLVGHWRLVAKGPFTTEVEYQVQADPGGFIPAWLVNLVTRKLPFRTLQGLRQQVTAKGYDHHLAMVQLAIDWAPFGVRTSTAGPARRPQEQDRSLSGELNSP